MRSFSSLLVLLLLAAPALAQRGGPISVFRPILNDCTATSGACPTQGFACLDTSDNTIKRCKSGVWTTVAGGTVTADSVALTTDTTGNYVASITNGTGITGGDGGSEGAALTLATTLGTSIDDSEVDNDLTLAGATIGTSAITLVQGAAPTPTAEGVIEWETDDDHLVVGDGADQVEFVPTEDVSGDISMTTAGVASLEADSVANTEMDDIDHGDVAWVSGIAYVQQVTDANNNALVKFVSGGATADNEITITSAEAGFDPSIAVTGADANIDLELSGKGTGTVIIGGSGSSSITGNGTSDLTLDGNGQDVVVVEQLVASNLGVEFTDSDTNPTCGAGNYNIFADLSDTKLKKCVNGAASELIDTHVECFTLYDADTLSAVNLQSVWGAPAAVTITAIWCEADQPSDVTLNFNKDDSCNTPAMSATNIEDGDLQCNTSLTSGVVVTASGEDHLADGDCVDLEIVAATSADRVTACFEYTYD